MTKEIVEKKMSSLVQFVRHCSSNDDEEEEEEENENLILIFIENERKRMSE